MSIKGYKLSIFILFGVIGFLIWRCWVLSRQSLWAVQIEQQCKITQEILKSPPDNFGPADLAQRLDFFTGYYDAHSNSLTGSLLAEMVHRNYQQTVTNVVTEFRRITTNDLGNDPKAWIKKYER
jgi:hypothetical protein